MSVRRRVGRWLAAAGGGAKLTLRVEMIGISRSSARNWVDLANGTTHKKNKPALVPVQIVTEQAASRAPVLISPNGYRVEGLSIDDLAHLLGRL